MSQIETYLRQLHDLRVRDKHGGLDGWRYPTIEAFLLQYGRLWKPMPLGRHRFVRMPIQQCFANALKLALRRPDLTYVEGWAGRLIPIHHAWCVDEVGAVVDPTWRPLPPLPDPEEYFGVPFLARWVQRVVRQSRLSGVLYNYRSNFSCLTEEPETFLDPRWAPTLEQTGG